MATIPNTEVVPMTFHKSKGLEANESLILGAVSDQVSRRSFPSCTVEDEFITLPLPQKEKYEFAEERRLFYVALTRAKKRVIIPVPSTGMSRFVSEILSYGSSAVSLFHRGTPLKSCPFCTSGALISSQNGDMTCTNVKCEHSGQSKKPICNRCKTGHIVLRRGKFGLFLGCTKYPACKNTIDIQKKDPTEPQNYIKHSCKSCRRFLTFRGRNECFFDPDIQITDPSQHWCDKWS